METINLGKVAFAYKGDYNPSTTYASKDVVFDGESSYISKSDGNVGNALSNTDFWGYLAKGSSLKYGTTQNRPTYTSIGEQYFDTTLSKPIWYNGSNWVDSTGINV